MFFQPDKFFSRISRIDIQKDLIQAGKTKVLLDIDNTILSRETSEIPRDVRVWLSCAREAGVRFCLVTNNWHQRVFEVASELGLPIVAKAIKPLPPAFLRALKKIGAKRSEAVVIGDQLITDCFGGHFLGLPVYMVLPLAEVDLKHTLLLRNLEKLFMGARCPEDEEGSLSDGAVATQAKRSHKSQGSC